MEHFEGGQISWEQMSAFFRRHPNWMWGGAALMGVGAFLFPLYMLGTFGNGYESRRITFQGVGSSESGFSLGSKTCYLNAGEELVVHYEAEVHRGGLTLLVKDFKQLIGGTPIGHFKINKTSSGKFRARAPESGFYELRTFGSPDGNGYDVSYTLKWWEE